MSERLSPDERKTQIIEAALMLFRDRGYENTTVSEIIDAAGISKGGFYHHYDSKEQLLRDIAQDFVCEVLGIIGEISQRDDLSALEKLNEYIRMANAYKKERPVKAAAFLAELYSGGKNLQLANMIFELSGEALTPVMRDIIRQGIAEGDFSTEYPEEAAEMYVKLFLLHQNEMAEAFHRWQQEDGQEGLERIIRKYRFFQETMEHMLGLERGALVLEEIATDVMQTLKDKMDGLYPPPG